MSLDDIKGYMTNVTQKYIYYKFQIINTNNRRNNNFFFEQFKKLSELDIEEIIKLYFEKYNLCKELINAWKEYYMTYKWNIPQWLIEHYKQIALQNPTLTGRQADAVRF